MRIGIIGTGFGQSGMAAAFGRTDGCEVADVVSPRDLDAVRSLCTRTDIDLVSVHSPPFLHERDVLLALAGGRHVICDKPFGHTEKSATSMLTAAREAGVIHLTNFELRYEPWRNTVRTLILDGVLGTLESIDWHEIRDSWRVAPPGWQAQESTGGGWLGASVSHTVDALTGWLGPLHPTAATLHRFDDGADSADDACVVHLTSKLGARCTVVSSSIGPRTVGRSVVISGSAATLELMSDGTMRLDGAAWPAHVTLPETGMNSFGAALDAWCALVRDHVDNGADHGLPTFEDGERCAALLREIRVVAAR